MLMRKMGKNGPEVSVLGLGAMSFAGFYGPTTEEEVNALLDHSRAIGVTHIDTSNIYGMGKSETLIGSYLEKTGARDDFYIATKAGITKDADGKRCYDNSLAHIEAELDGSLKRLNCDYVDLFYIHRRQEDMPIEEVTEGLVKLVEKGKIKAFGFSEIAPASLRRANEVAHVAAVQSEYSLSTRAPELGLVQTCAELGTALVAFSPVGRGLLSDTPPDAAKAEKIAFLRSNPRFQGVNLQKNLEYVGRLQALAAEMGTSTAALAMAWVAAQGEHLLPIPGTRSIEHLNQLADGCALTLSADDIARIETVLPVGWAYGDRYSDEQWVGPERFS